MPTSTLSQQGQVTIPKIIREALHLSKGDKIAFVINKYNEVTIKAVGNETKLNPLDVLTIAKNETTTIKSTNTAYDNPWKDIIELYFKSFMLFFFRYIHDEIDWTKPPVFLDKELSRIVKNAEEGNKHVDKLVQATLLNGEDTLLYIHVEIQSQYEKGFEQRVFVYNYRLYNRYKKPVVTLVIFGDNSKTWRPDQYTFSLFGCELVFKFPTIKLLDYQKEWAKLEKLKNPFSIIVRAHLKALETTGDPNKRLNWKVYMHKALHEEGYEKKEIFSLLNFINWMLTLPEEMETKYRDITTKYEEVKKVKYINSFERAGIKKGIKKGRLEEILDGIKTGLHLKFNQISHQLFSPIREITEMEKLKKIQEGLFIINDANEFKRFMEKTI